MMVQRLIRKNGMKKQCKALTSDLSFTIIGERKVTLLCVEVLMANDTKERILAAALELFSRNGYAGTNIRELSASLGLVKSGVYKHYVSYCINYINKIFLELNDFFFLINH